MHSRFSHIFMLRALAGLCLAAAVAGCPAEESPDVEACEHLQQGPFVPITSGGAVDDDHRRYDLTLTPSANPSGTATFASGADGRYLVFLTKAIPLTIRRDGVTTSAEDRVVGSDECTEIAVRDAFHMGVGTYELVFGSTTETTVGIIIEAEVAP